MPDHGGNVIDRSVSDFGAIEARENFGGAPSAEPLLDETLEFGAVAEANVKRPFV